MESPSEILTGIECVLRPAGHLLGASIVELKTRAGNIVFSGDLGRLRGSILIAPTIVRDADYLVVESTYGNRCHDNTDPEIQLGDIIRRTAARGGIVVVPSFAVGRAQELMYALLVLSTNKGLAMKTTNARPPLMWRNIPFRICRQRFLPQSLSGSLFFRGRNRLRRRRR